jgi:RNA polymerase-binding transcription factor DksA
MKTKRFEGKLLAEKEKLESALGNIGRRNPRVPNDWEPVPPLTGTESDLADQADVVMSRENNAAVLADLEARYDTVLAALSRIEKKTYGMCEVCGRPIEEARLDADPAATTCIAHL